MGRLIGDWKIGCGCIAFLFLTCGGLYQAAYFAWITATPLTQQQLANTQLAFYFWFWITSTSLLGGVVMLVWSLRRQKR